MRFQNQYHEKTQRGSKEFQRYIVAGLINTFVGFFVYSACVEITPLPYWAANFCAMCAGIICGFMLARHYVFTDSKHNPLKRLPKYVITITLQFVVSTTLIAIFIQLGVSEVLSYVASLPFVILLSFALQKMWVFQPLAENK